LCQLGSFDNYSDNEYDSERRRNVQKLTDYAFSRVQMSDASSGEWVDVFSIGAGAHVPQTDKELALLRRKLSCSRAYVDNARRELYLPMYEEGFSVWRLAFCVAKCFLALLTSVLCILALHIFYPSKYAHPGVFLHYGALSAHDEG
jgi:hypothetical protein